MAATMETVQYVFKSAAGVDMGVWRSTNPFLDFFVILVQEITCLIVVCVFWWLFFYKLYHSFELYFQGRHCKARHIKLLNDLKKLSEEQKAAIALHWPLEESSQTPSQAAETITSGGVSGDDLPMVPVKLLCTCTLKCGWMTCKRKLMNLALTVRAPCQPVTCLETDFGCVVQTQLHLNAERVNKLRRRAARKLCGEVTVQLGRWRTSCLVDGEVKPMDIEECESSDQNNRVPVLFNASFRADTLTIEGLNLAKASLFLVNKRGDCGLLKTECTGESSPRVAVSTVSDEELPSTTFTGACTYSAENYNIPGAGGLEIHKYMISLPKDRKCNAEFSVIAFKKIIKDSKEVWMSSLPVDIKDDSLRTVIRDILPSTVIIFFAAKQTWACVGFTTFIVAWLICFMIIAFTSTLQESIETMTKQLLEKMTAHVWTFYEAYRTYKYNLEDKEDSEDEEDDSEDVTVYDSEDEEDAGDSKTDEEDAEVDLETDGNLSCSVKAKVEVEANRNFRGSRLVHSADWQWPIYDTVHKGEKSYLQLREESKDEKMDQNAKTNIPFEVVYLHIKHLPWASQVQVNIFSSFLKSLLPIDADRWKSCKKKVEMDGPELFRNYATLSAHRVSCVEKLESPDPAPNASIRDELSHITHLVRFMDKEFEDIACTYEAMKTDRQLRWDMLWAFLPPGELVVYVDEVTDECVCGKVLWTKYKISEGGLFLIVKVTKWDYNCQSWDEHTNTVTVPAFSGDREIKGLSIRPLRFEKDPDATEKSFLNHGKRFCELSMMQSNCYMNYKGSLVSYIWVDKCFRIVKENANGRVMIDLCSFSKMNPDFPLDSAKPPCEIIRDNITIPVDITQSPNRMFAPSFVYGFSFRLKKWGCFSVAGFTEIVFNDSAFDELVMVPSKKALTYSLVKERLKEGSKKEGPQASVDRVDPIANKGDACILLCYGPPGTGKTLTAESLSEKLECPLWCLNVFELGVTPAALETMLVKVLDIAASWGAILLLDEADVYLERRSSKDLVRNSMTGVFLRHLEYYRGVLFLTTNRVAAFDEAICSRITLSLYYGRHDECQRSAIWKTLFGRLGLEDCTSEILAEFSKPDFNGREITKIVRTAQTLANSKEQKLQFQHVRDALEVYEESSKLWASMNSSTGASILPAHQQPTKQHLESRSSPLDLHSSSTAISAEAVHEERPLELSLSSNFDRETTVKGNQTCESSGSETPTSRSNETIEAVTPVSPSNGIHHVPTARAFYRM